MMARLRERTWRFWLAVAALLALAGGIVYIALNWYEIADRSDYQGMQGEALTNPYLAMQRTLGAMGAKMETIKGSAAWDQALLEQLPAGSVREIQYAPPGATLFLGDRRLARMRDKRVTQLREWVRAGGNLIIEAEQPKLDDPLLQSYGIGHVGLRITKEGKWVERRAPNRGKIPDSEKNAKNSKGAEAADEENDPPQDDEPEDTDFTSDEDDTVSQNLLKLAAKLRDSVTSTIEFPDDTEFKVSFKPYQNLKLIKRSKLPENAVVIDDEIGTRLIQFRDGKGQVTIASNFDFMTERALGKKDHAEFLWHITATQHPTLAAGKAPRVLLALRDTSPGLWKWLAENAWMALIAALALLLAWLARIVPRFGPLTPNASPARLSLREHLSAIGRYLSRHNGWESLAHAARERFHKRTLRDRPGLSRLDRDEMIAALEKLTGVGGARIARALGAPVTDQRGFTEVIRTLKAIEQASDYHRAASVKSSRSKPAKSGTNTNN